MRGFVVVGWLLGAGLWPACTVDVDLSDKPCPCAEGFHCVADQCVAGAARDAGSLDGGNRDAAPEAGPPDAPWDAGAEPGAFVVSSLRADWTTPNVIRWRWDRAGEAADFGELRLVVAESMEDLASLGGSARLFDTTTNPELGVYLLLRTGTPDPVVQTLTGGHDPTTRYYAQITAIDSVGRAQLSNVATATTAPAPIGEMVLFADDEPPGYPFPPGEVLRVTEAPYAGTTHHLKYVHDSCADGTEACWEAVRWQNLGLGPVPFSEGTFATTAYLEIALAYDGPTPLYWSEVWLFFGPDGSSLGWGFAPFTLQNDDAYHVLQVPLRALRRSASGALTYEDTREVVHQFRVGAGWQVGATLRIDEVRVRW